MKRFLAIVAVLVMAGIAEAASPGGVIVNNNNNARQAQARANNVIRPRRPVLRFLFPRAALRRDREFGPPNAVRAGQRSLRPGH